MDTMVRPRTHRRLQLLLPFHLATMVTAVKMPELRNPPKDEQEYAFVGLSTGHQKKLTTRNDPVAFCDKLKKVMAGEEGGIWAMPEDQTTVDGISTLPQADYLTPMRVENTMVEVYPVQGGSAILLFHEETVTDWARLLVAEVSKQGDSEYMVQRGIISGRCFGGLRPGRPS